MEGQSAKRRRVYSVEPNKVVQTMFTRNYVNYLVPALMKIKERSSTEHSKHCDLENVVKHEVDMAMVFSAQGFAWSDALKVKLRRGGANVASSTTSFVVKDDGDKGNSSRVFDQNEMVPLNFSSNPSSKSQQAKILVKETKYIGMEEKKKVSAKEDNYEDEAINNQLKCLRMLIPGGEDMCSEQMVVELESYISCLQMQVNILQCLAETS